MVAKLKCTVVNLKASGEQYFLSKCNKYKTVNHLFEFKKRNKLNLTWVYFLYSTDYNLLVKLHIITDHLFIFITLFYKNCSLVILQTVTT